MTPNNIRTLLCLPVPVLGQEARSFRRVEPAESRTAISEHAIGDLGADVEGEDRVEGDVGAVGEAAHLEEEVAVLRLHEGGEELLGEGGDLGPGEVCGALEH